MLGEGADPVIADALRVPDQQRHMEGLWEEPGLAEHPVVAEHLAMVRGEQDQCLVQIAPVGQPIEDPAQMAIDLADQAPVDGAQAREALAVEQLAAVDSRRSALLRCAAARGAGSLRRRVSAPGREAARPTGATANTMARRRRTAGAA